MVFDGTLTAAKLRVVLEHFVPNLATITGELEGPYRSFPRQRSQVPIGNSDFTPPLCRVPDAGQPPSSPDLNVIEIVWHVLNDKAQQHQPADKRAFVRVIEEEWANLPTSLPENLIDSLPCHLAASKATKGGSTQF